MIERVYWHDRSGFNEVNMLDRLTGKLISPFDQNALSRPLRITFHFQSLNELADEEKEALDVLLEFSSTPPMEVLQLGIGDFTPILFGEKLDQYGYPLRVYVDYGGRGIQGMIHNTEWLREFARQISMRPKNNSEIVDDIYNDLLAAHASFEIGQDIIVTNSKWLIENRIDNRLSPTNPRTPLETLKILGLLLRSRGDYRYASKARCNPSFFYEIVALSKTPALWRYLNIASYCNKNNKRGDLLELIRAILNRSQRLIQAYDYMGALFYRQHTHDLLDNLMYHFDYLYLLMSGILDAQALVVFRLLNGNRSSEKNASFRKPEFIKFLEKATPSLYKYISNKQVKQIVDLVFEIRNTIHREDLPIIGMENQFTLKKESLIHVPETHNKNSNIPTLWEICQEIAKEKTWGIVKDGNVMYIEPMTFSRQLLEKALKVIDEIAERTDFFSLVLEGETINLSEIPDGLRGYFGAGEKARRFTLLSL